MASDRNPHDWRLLDAETGMEVRRTASGWEVRTRDSGTKRLTDAEFDRLRDERLQPNESGRAANPNPSYITDAVWRAWETAKTAIPGVRLGGIYAAKPGYHNTVNANSSGNYSVQLGLDDTTPRTKARALDLTMSDTQMRACTQRLLDATERRDSRLRGIREFYGTVNGQSVLGRIKDSESGVWRSSTSDSSHLWHIHISFFTTHCDDWSMVSPVIAVVTGQEDYMIGLRIGDSGERVRYLQRTLGYAGFSVGEIDGEYGSKTESAVKACRKWVGSSENVGDRISGTGAAQIERAARRREAQTYGGRANAAAEDEPAT